MFQCGQFHIFVHIGGVCDVFSANIHRLEIVRGNVGCASLGRSVAVGDAIDYAKFVQIRTSVFEKQVFHVKI